MKASRKWIIWAHGPPAESGIESSSRLMDLAEDGGRGNIDVPPDLVAELLAVAECYGPGSATDEMGPWWRGERDRVVREARAALAKVGA